MDFHIEEGIHPQLDYYDGENPIAALEGKGWELVQLIPEYDLVQCDPPAKLADPTSSKLLNITGKLQISSYVALFRQTP